MSTIRHHKRQARLRATARGTSLQSELNAIARENGHAAWGDFQRTLRAAPAKSAPTPFDITGLSHPDDETSEVEALADAFEAARAKGGHLVVLREIAALEVAAIAELAGPKGESQAHRLEGASFVAELTRENMAEAASAGLTLIAGSGDMPRDTDHGNFIATRHDQHLRYGQSLVSRRDRDMLYATTSVKYILPRNDRETVELIQGMVGPTTVKRGRGMTGQGRRPAITIPSTLFRSVDEGGMPIEMEWDASKGEPNADIVDYPFTPAFNALGPKFLPEEPEARREHIDRIAHILMPRQGEERSYFDEKGRQTLIGFLHAETGRAARGSRPPSIPALIDWIGDGLRTAAAKNDRAKDEAADDGAPNDGDALSDWLKSVVEEATEGGDDRLVADRISPLVSMAPNERTGILGTMDKAFLPFRNRHVRERAV